MSPVEDIMKKTKANPLKALNQYGQSVWLDYIRHNLIASGELKAFVEDDGLRGVTSNPAIFEKAITGSTDYAELLGSLEGKEGLNATEIYERLAIRDIQDAADLLRPVYDQSSRRDGYVSLEVSPYKARDTQATVEEARRLWKAVGRENVMIKVPATEEGGPAIERLIGEGINVNVTLLFALEAYERVARAYLSGLEAFSSKGGDLARVASVASFFVSRIDTAVDGLLESRIKAAPSSEEKNRLRGLFGKVAIANAKLAYQKYLEFFRGARWEALAARGAQTQRLLWASTGTKNPKYSDVLYVDELIGPDTVNTIPPSTYDAFRHHGKPRASLQADPEIARETLLELERAHISLKEVTDQLLQAGVAAFAGAFDKLLASVDKSCQPVAWRKLNSQSLRLPAGLSGAVEKSLEEWRLTGKVRQLWAQEAALWTGADEGRWLGWLGITEDQLARAAEFTGLAAEIQKEGFTHVVLLGMGGSSLSPEVMKLTFGQKEGYPEFHVLDSTDPDQIGRLEKSVDLPKTLFIVSSKSGSTLEPNIFKRYFFERIKNVLGPSQAGRHFIAVTDPGSKMQRVAEQDNFRHIFYGLPSIGGRYSALSDFGMIPAAIMGVDVPRFLDSAQEMVHACSSCVPIKENPAVVLGTVLGVLAKNGRDKVTVISSAGIRDLGAWLEQLLAESTGKEGKGLIPVDRELLGDPRVYGADRLFVTVRLESEADAAQEKALARLQEAGHPLVEITLKDPYDVAQEFFRWEMATAVAGAIIGINAFNQPDVEASKLATVKLTDEYEKSGKLPLERPLWSGEGVQLFTDDRNARELGTLIHGTPALDGYLKAHLDRLAAGDYAALLAYIEMNDVHDELLQKIRMAVRDRKRVATCVGFGPRFLHSTGQAYKGGPNSGVFIQITCDQTSDLDIPGQKYTFGLVKAAQARGDFQVLAERGRRALRVHLGSDVAAGLKRLQDAVERALQ